MSIMPQETSTSVSASTTPAIVESVRRGLRSTPRSTSFQRAGSRRSGGSSRSARLRRPRPPGENGRIASAGRDARRGERRRGRGREPGQEAERDPGQRRPRRQARDGDRDRELARVDVRELAGQREAEQRSDQCAAEASDEAEAEIVAHDRRAREAGGAQRADDRALRGDDAGEDDRAGEPAGEQEQQREHDRQRAEALDVLLQRAVGWLLGARHRRGRAGRVGGGGQAPR